MSRLPLLTAKELLKIILKLDFRFKRQKGSHIFLKHPEGRTTLIPFHSKEEIKITVARNRSKEMMEK